MKKVLFLIGLIITTSMFAIDYVTVKYYVASPSGVYPTTLYATGVITYDEYSNPVHTIIPVVAAYDKTTGIATWKFPKNNYVKFVCQATGLSGTYKIVDGDGDGVVILNTLIPSLPPPEPSWTANYVPYTGAMANLDLGTFGLTTNSFKLSQAPHSDWILVSDNLGNGTWQNHKTAQWADMTDITDYTFFGSNSKPLKITGGVNIIGRTYEMRIGNEESSHGDVNTYRLVLSAEDNGFYGYSGAMVWEARPKGGGDIRQAEMWWFGNNGFGLQISDSINGDAHYSFKSDGLYLEDGLFWNSNNDGSGSGLDADLLDGNESSYYEKALTFSSPLSRTVDTVSITQSSATTDGYLSSADWNTFNGKDGVVGNEVTDTADTSLTRTGTGASDDPYKLKLNLANSNTFTANQTAPYWLSSTTFNPNNPRPLGYPLSSAHALDEEFNGTLTQSWQEYGSGSSASPDLTTYNGYAWFKTNGAKPYYALDLGTSHGFSGDFSVTMKLGDVGYGSHFGLFVGVDDNGDATPELILMLDFYAGASIGTTFVRCDNLTSGWSSIPCSSGTAVFTIPSYVRISRRSGNFYAEYSVNGGTLYQVVQWHNGTSYEWSKANSGKVRYVGIYQTPAALVSGDLTGGTVDWIRFTGTQD